MKLYFCTHNILTYFSNKWSVRAPAKLTSQRKSGRDVSRN